MCWLAQKTNLSSAMLCYTVLVFSYYWPGNFFYLSSQTAYVVHVHNPSMTKFCAYVFG